MKKEYTALGLMSGTSGDGVDASIIISDGINSYKVIQDKYFEYDKEICENIHNLKKKIHNQNNLKDFSSELNTLEKTITLFHAKIIKNLTDEKEIDLVGFHGQTIYHSSKEKISKQLGDGKLLSQLTKKNIVYNFRQNDIKNGGEGAPLTPIFHQLILKENKIDVPSCILNIGGISNITIVENLDPYNFRSKDIGPGNCLIDSWVRNNSEKKFDKDGMFSSSGKKNDIILEQAQELYLNSINKNSLSFDVNDFDVSFVRGLTLEDGAATLTHFTGRIIGAGIINFLSRENKPCTVLLSGGGRKNKSLIKIIKEISNKNITLKLIDDYGVNGDFVESQAFAYLAIRSLKNEPISFPHTTGCSKPCSGGEIIKST